MVAPSGKTDGKQNGSLMVSTPSEREILMTRMFNAPRPMVFDAMTKPELVKRWGAGPPGWSMELCEIDLRVGGKWRQVMVGPDGMKMGIHGVHREVKAPERVVRTEKFDEAWYAGDAVGTMVLTEIGTTTMVAITMMYDSKDIRDGVLKTPMESGVGYGMDKLEELLRTLAA